MTFAVFAALAYNSHMKNFASTTLANLDAYFSGAPLENEICYRCTGTERPEGASCPRRTGGRCH